MSFHLLLNHLGIVLYSHPLFFPFLSFLSPPSPSPPPPPLLTCPHLPSPHLSSPPLSHLPHLTPPYFFVLIPSPSTPYPLPPTSYPLSHTPSRIESGNGSATVSGGNDSATVSGARSDTDGAYQAYGSQMWRSTCFEATAPRNFSSSPSSSLSSSLSVTGIAKIANQPQGSEPGRGASSSSSSSGSESVVPAYGWLGCQVSCSAISQVCVQC